MLYLFTLFGFFINCLAFETDLTVDVGPGKMECFFQPIKKPVKVEIEYQVIDGGDLDINFFIQGPDGKVLISQHRKTDDLHKIDIEMAGDMKLCLDNTFSHFASKIVFFEIISDDEEEEEDTGKWEGAKEELQELVDMTLDDFKEMMVRMGQHLDKSRNTQTVLKMYQSRDRNVVEANFERVNLFSSVQLVIMLAVGLTQVLLIRNLFNDRSKVSGTMKTQT